MFVAGVGIGPTLSVFTIVIQNAVPFSKLGVATSNLTFFRQVGGSVGLAIAGTVFGQGLADKLQPALIPVGMQAVAAAPPDQRAALGTFLQSPALANIDLNDLTGVGKSFGTAIVNAAPPDLHATLQAFVPQLDAAFNNAMSLAIAQTFWIGVGAAILGLLAALFMREIPLRTTNETPAKAGASTGGPKRPALPAAD